MTRHEIASKIENDHGLQEALDEIIHDRHSNMASELNNQGANKQLKWLEENCGEDVEDVFAVISTK